MVSEWASPRFRQLMVRIDKLRTQVKGIQDILDAPRRIHDFEKRLDRLEKAAKRRRTRKKRINIKGPLRDVMPFGPRKHRTPTVLVPRSEGTSELSKISLRDVMGGDDE